MMNMSDSSERPGPFLVIGDRHLLELHGEGTTEAQSPQPLDWSCPGLVEGELLRCTPLPHALSRLVGAVVVPFWGDTETAPPGAIVDPRGNATADCLGVGVMTAAAA